MRLALAFVLVAAVTGGVFVAAVGALVKEPDAPRATAERDDASPRDACTAAPPAASQLARCLDGALAAEEEQHEVRVEARQTTCRRYGQRRYVCDVRGAVAAGREAGTAVCRAVQISWRRAAEFKRAITIEGVAALPCPAEEAAGSGRPRRVE